MGIFHSYRLFSTNFHLFVTVIPLQRNRWTRKHIMKESFNGQGHLACFKKDLEKLWTYPLMHFLITLCVNIFIALVHYKYTPSIAAQSALQWSECSSGCQLYCTASNDRTGRRLVWWKSLTSATANQTHSQHWSSLHLHPLQWVYAADISGIS